MIFHSSYSQIRVGQQYCLTPHWLIPSGVRGSIPDPSAPDVADPGRRAATVAFFFSLLIPISSID